MAFKGSFILLPMFLMCLVFMIAGCVNDANASPVGPHKLTLNICIADSDVGAASNNCFTFKDTYDNFDTCRTQREAIIDLPIEVYAPDGNKDGTPDANSGAVKNWTIRPQTAGNTGNLVKYVHGDCVSTSAPITQ